jgi:hypothetical protein
MKPMMPGDIPMAEYRNGSSEPSTPAPTMISAVLTSGGATRHGMRVALVAGVETVLCMTVFIAESRNHGQIVRDTGGLGNGARAAAPV